MEAAQVQYNIKRYLTVTTMAVALAATIVISALIFSNMRSKLSTVRSELASSKVMYSLVVAEKHRLDSLIGLYTHSIALRDNVIAIKDREIQKQVSRIVALENNMKQIQLDMAKITADSSYKYLNKVMPIVAEQNYGFDSTQVKTIHRTFLERDELRNINLEYSITTGVLLSTSMLKDAQITDLKSLIDLHLSKEAILRKERESDKVAIEDLNKNIKQQKRQKNWLIGGVAGVATVIIIKSITQ
jgi:hypothetical protein